MIFISYNPEAIKFNVFEKIIAVEVPPIFCYWLCEIGKHCWSWPDLQFICVVTL